MTTLCTDLFVSSCALVTESIVIVIFSSASTTESSTILSIVIVAPILPAGIVIVPPVKLWSSGIVAVPETE